MRLLPGLQSVFSADEELALRMLHKLDVGTGYVNGCSEMSALLPWSGRQQSGMGCTLGLHSLRATFLRPKSLLLRRPAPLPLVEKRPHIHLSPLPGTHHKAQPGHAHRSDQLHVHSELVRPGRSAGEEEQQR